MNNFLIFLSELLNREIDFDTEFALSSAQRARSVSWLQSNNFEIPSNCLKGRVRLRDLEKVLRESTLDSRKSARKEERPQHDVLKNQLGVDLQSIDEFLPNVSLDDSDALGKIFTKYELQYVSTQPNPKESLTGLFAAKEAIIKAGYRCELLNEIEIMHSTEGAPFFPQFMISISHSAGFVIAIAMAVN